MVALDHLKALIIEDDLSESIDLQQKLEHIGITSIESSFSFDESVEKIKKGHYDLAFVDIILDKDDTGIVLAELLIHKNIPFIITTNHADLSMFYSLKKYSPLAYFQKPIDSLELRFRLENFTESCSDSKTDFFFHKDGSEFIRIEKADIIYLEVEGNYVMIFTSNEKYMVRSSLKSLLEKIDSSAFVQIHRKWAIRIDLVKSYNGRTNKAVLGDLTFPVGRKFQSKVAKRLANI